ncbi:MAG: IgGFc-binding protein, partial [Myxococcales bacterium]|nr:IgGFc-binding protein [Myxococcales bacterium]
AACGGDDADADADASASTAGPTATAGTAGTSDPSDPTAATGSTEGMTGTSASSGPSGSDASSSASESDPTTTTETTETTVDPTDSGDPSSDTEPSPDLPVELGCSADLHAIVDGDGELVETCPQDQGCLDGACVPACEAATGSLANFGCEFKAPTPPSYPNALPPCFAVFLTNTWGYPAQIDVWRDGVDLDPTEFGRVVTPGLEPKDWPPVPAEGVPEGGVVVLFLSSHPNAIMPENQVPLTCPVTPAVNASTQVDGSGRGATFEISADIPLTAYDILPFGGARSHFPSAELLFPTSVWGTNYVTIVPPAGTHSSPGPLWMQIVGLEDDTLVNIIPAANLKAGAGVEAAAAGVIKEFTVDAGEYVQWEIAAGGEASGSIIDAKGPVAVFTGNRFLRLQPMPAPGGEAAHQEINAISALGARYVAAPYETRKKDLSPEEIDYRVVGVIDGTSLTYEPPIPGAPVTLDQGQVVDFATALPFLVESQGSDNPFLIAQLMDTANLPGGTRPGATAPGFGLLLGDEEYVLMLPPEQFMNRYVFFTDPTYATTNLVFTRVNEGDGFQEVTVDCLGEISGWQPVGDGSTYEVATADLMRADIGVNGCTNGHHIAESEGPFGLVVWGLDSYSSYAYPAGGSAKALTDVTVPIE